MFHIIFWALIVGLLTFFGLATYVGTSVAVASISAAIATLVAGALIAWGGRL